MRTTYPLLLLACLLSLLGGCAKSPPLPPEPKLSFHERHEALHQLGKWQFEGKISYVTADHSRTARVHWVQYNDNFDILIAAPFNLVTLQLNGNATELRYDASSGEHGVTQDPRQWLTKRFGWTPPLEHMGWWVKGLPSPDVPVDAKDYNAMHQLTKLTQAGWHITFHTYQPSPFALYLPRSVMMEQGNVRVKLAVAEWAKA